jgi:hypothetical protein
MLKLRYEMLKGIPNRTANNGFAYYQLDSFEVALALFSHGPTTQRNLWLELTGGEFWYTEYQVITTTITFLIHKGRYS